MGGRHPTEVERIDPAGVHDSTGNRIAEVRLEVIGRIAGCNRRRAIEIAHGEDVGDHRGDDVSKACLDIGIFGLREVRHDRGLPRVIGVLIVDAIGCGTIVIARMAKTQRMTDLVNIGLQ